MAEPDVLLRNQLTGTGPICRAILRTLPSWFGIEQAVENYVDVADRSPSVIASIDGQDVGILTVLHHGAFAAEVHVIAVLPAHHRRGIGRRMLKHVKDSLAQLGVEFLQVRR